MKNKVCKNKKCMKPLPEGYKYKYCEACRNKQTENFKTGVKAVAALTSTAACVAVTILTSGKINPKK